MSEKDNGGPAFPIPAAEHSQGGHFQEYGMSLRDYFAAAALTGFLADGSQRLVNEAVVASPEGKLIADTQALARIVNGEIAKGCYALADAMLAVGSKTRD